MTRLVAEHFNGAGRPKRAFVDESEARGFLNARGLRGRFAFYRCSVCGKWHLASKPKRFTRGLTHVG